MATQCDLPPGARRTRPKPGAQAAAVLMVPTWGFAVFVSESSVLGGEGGPGSLVKSLPVLFLAGLAVLVLRRAPSSIRQMIRESAAFRSIIHYLGWLLLCAALAPAPDMSILRLAQAVVPVFASVAFATRSLRRDWLLVATTAAMLLHIALSYFNPTFVGPEDDQLRQVGSLVANSYAVAAAIPLVAAVGYLAVGRKAILPVLAIVVPLCTYGVITSKGRTAALAVLFGLAVVLVARTGHRRTRTGISLGRLMPVIAVLAALPLLVATNYQSFELWFLRGDGQQLATLTGRTDIWSVFIEPVLSGRPLTGYGPGAVRLAAVPGVPEQYEALGSAHNSLIEALVIGGLVGAALWVRMLWKIGVIAILRRRPERALTAAVFASLVVFSVTLGNLAGFGMAWYALCALLPILLRSHTQRASSSSPPILLHSEQSSREMGSAEIPGAAGQRSWS